MAEISKITLPNGSSYNLKDATARSTGKVSGVKGNSQSTYRTGNVNITAENVGAFEKKSYDRGTLEAGIRPLVDQTRANRLVFLPADQIIIEKTTNGGITWEDAEISDSAKINLFVNGQSIPIPLLNNAKSTQCGIRITITGMKYNVPVGTTETNKYNYWNSTYINRQQRYFNVREWWFWISSNNDSIKPEIYCATGAQPNNWVTVFNKDFGMKGWSGSDWIRAGGGETFGGSPSQVTNYWNWRLIFWSKFADNKTEFLSNTVQYVSKIKCYGDSVWAMPYKLGQMDHIYSYDISQNTTFPANVTATQFNGNATSASKLNSTRSFTIGKTAKNVDWSGAVSFSQAEISDNASTSAAGWMSKDDKIKLNGIETGAQVNTVTGVKGGSESSYRTGDVNITATNIGLGNVTNNKQVKGLSSGTTNNNLVAWGSDGYTVADSGIAKGSVATKLALSGTNYSASSNTITVTKANLQSAVQDSSLVLMTAAERTKLASIETGGNYVTIGTEQTITGAKTFTQRIQVGQDTNPLFFIKPTSISFHHSRSEGSPSFFVGDQRNNSNNYEFTSSYPDRVVANDSTFLQTHYIINTDYNVIIRDEDDNSISYTSIDGKKIYGDFTQGAKYSIQYTTSNEVLGFHYGTVNSHQSYGGSATAFGTSVAGGYLSHAEGEEGKALGEASHVEGYLNQSIGYYSHAQGSFTHAEGEASHSQGYGTNADGKYAHAQGRFSFAKGQASHAQGDSTAIGRFSHSEGASCYAIGEASHASGWGTYAIRRSQTVIGRYNKLTGSSSASSLVCSNDLLCGNDVLVGGNTLDSDSGNYAFIIGNGQSYAQRSNAFTVDWDGYIEVSGGYISQTPTITIGNSPSENYYRTCFSLKDNTGTDYARILHTYLADGRSGISIEALRDINNSTVWNTFRILISENGERTIYLSEPSAWRNALGMGAFLATYANHLNNNNQTYSNIPCAGFLTNSSKQLIFHFPCNIIAGDITITSLSLAVRGGSGQEYLYEASGSGTTYTQLGTQPVVVWESSKTKRTNGVENIYASLKVRSGVTILVNFKNQLRKSASTTVAQNNMPVSIYASFSFTISN